MAGNPRLDDLTPQFAQQVRRALPAIARDLGKSSKMTSLSFLMVDQDGFDVFHVQHEQAARDWHVLVNSDGKVAQAWAREVL